MTEVDIWKKVGELFTFLPVDVRKSRIGDNTMGACGSVSSQQTKCPSECEICHHATTYHHPQHPLTYFHLLNASANSASHSKGSSPAHDNLEQVLSTFGIDDSSVHEVTEPLVTMSLGAESSLGYEWGRVPSG